MLVETTSRRSNRWKRVLPGLNGPSLSDRNRPRLVKEGKNRNNGERRGETSWKEEISRRHRIASTLQFVDDLIWVPSLRKNFMSLSFEHRLDNRWTDFNSAFETFEPLFDFLLLQGFFSALAAIVVEIFKTKEKGEREDLKRNSSFLVKWRIKRG